MKKAPLILFISVLLGITSGIYGRNPVPYSGKVSVDGVNFDGSAQFSFELIDANQTVHWHNGLDTNGTISVSVRNGRYLVLLGGQGMTPLPSRLSPLARLDSNRWYQTIASA